LSSEYILEDFVLICVYSWLVILDMIQDTLDLVLDLLVQGDDLIISLRLCAFVEYALGAGLIVSD
jgi:hypothetical protein